MERDVTGTRTFRGRTMREAVASLKAALGPEAVIVGTRRVQDPEGGYVEIHATVDEAVAPEETAPALGGARGAAAAYRRAAGTPPPVAKPAAPVAKPAAPVPYAAVPERDNGLTALREDLTALRTTVDQLAARLGTPMSSGVDEDALRRVLGPLAMQLRELRATVEGEANVDDADRSQARALQDALQRVGLSAAHARDVAWRVQRERPGATPDDAETLARVGRWLAREIKCTGDLLGDLDQRRVLAFVGPTGVGKTTTIGKVAAHAALLRGIPTALVTVDTYRLAAVEQLARYAEILECPLRVVKSPEELPGALAELSQHRLVLVDSTGRNPRLEDQVNALARFFPAGWGGELVLTLACNVRERDLFATVDAFERLNCTSVCVTKLDETDAPGALYSLARRTGKPLSWVTAGQRVPEDLEVAAPDVLAARIAARSAAFGGMAVAG